jgi:hypothetical protein
MVSSPPNLQRLPLTWVNLPKRFFEREVERRKRKRGGMRQAGGKMRGEGEELGGERGGYS